MKNKNTIVFLTTVITALCLYYLGITFFSRGIQQDALDYAKDESGIINQTKKQAYLDSIWREPVLNIFGAEFTYQEIKEYELNLGLDLQGGMHVTLEVSPVAIIEGLAGNSKDPQFKQAIAQASLAQKTGNDAYATLFADAYNDITSGGQLSKIFANAGNRGRIEFDFTNDQVMEVINEEVDNAIDRAFQILRTRIDRFGTSQPNIQRLAGTGRIQIELPGVDNPQRVRKLLQGVAKLEFWEVYEANEISTTLTAMNDALIKIEAADKSNAAATNLADELKPVVDENSLEAQLAGDSTNTGADALETPGQSKFFSLMRQGPYQGFFYNLADTSQINRALKSPSVVRVLPAGLKFLWSVKAEEGTELLQLFAIKTGRAGDAPLTGEVITDARQSLDERARPAVSMQMNAIGSKKWKNLTGSNINRRIAIALDNYVYTAPNVNGEIGGGNSQISGNFSVDEADDLANILKAGSLPAPTRIVEEAVIGPTLGTEAQRQGVTSILGGLAIVVVFMMFYYAKGGLVANIALLFNIFFILGILANLGAALTLPGIAGIVLTIGMSIDANVLIFERIREELRNGIPLLEAISSGYKKAYSSIIDANVTTFLTGVILYILGQGPLKGFAVTLMIGIVCSFFSAVFITRVIIAWMSRKGNTSKLSFETPMSKGWLTNINIDFLGKRRLAYISSTVVITIGIILMATNGLRLGVDFKGGRSYIVEFDQPMVASEVKSSLSGVETFKEAGLEVKTYNSSNFLKITTSYKIEEESTEADTEVKLALTNALQTITQKSFIDGTTVLMEDQFTINGSSKVTATIADDIKTSSLESFGLAILAIFFYILIRFRRWQFSLGAIIALIHDALIVLSAFAIAAAFGISFEIDQVFIGAILTIMGYSINDTVVVFDRIRENLQLKGSKDLAGTFNDSINSTVSRTLITSMTTLIVVLVLFIFGGEVLRGFSFAFFIGILVGTYSSVFIASPIVVDLTKRTLGKSADKEQEAARVKASARASLSAN
ncbi:MAG: SecD/SecF fusion protein [Roseivirga sp.]|jgi:SecD/SecF fusion protein